ncbi:hypothetical protein PPROV_000169200 [Pycnococcus provasolii]|uniref:Uncharacterized protein n=1 Tax=Pycnococcus provasolii TaxID=41880 RepID=A0A830HCX7_9CHLO|nr:hypothetical protein PPROV_000169200 [Pycnococcus provasolii]
MPNALAFRAMLSHVHGNVANCAYSLCSTSLFGPLFTSTLLLGTSRLCSHFTSFTRDNGAGDGAPTPTSAPKGISDDEVTRIAALARIPVAPAHTSSVAVASTQGREAKGAQSHHPRSTTALRRGVDDALAFLSKGLDDPHVRARVQGVPPLYSPVEMEWDDNAHQAGGESRFAASRACTSPWRSAVCARSLRANASHTVSDGGGFVYVVERP